MGVPGGEYKERRSVLNGKAVVCMLRAIVSGGGGDSPCPPPSTLPVSPSTMGEGGKWWPG